MTDQEVADALLRIFQQEVQIDLGVVDRTTTLAELDIPSVDMVMILYQIEEDLAVEVEPAELRPGMTLGEFEQLLLRKRHAA